jgi:hypothetical protein
MSSVSAVVWGVRLNQVTVTGDGGIGGARYRHRPMGELGRAPLRRVDPNGGDPSQLPSKPNDVTFFR